MNPFPSPANILNSTLLDSDGSPKTATTLSGAGHAFTPVKPSNSTSVSLAHHDTAKDSEKASDLLQTYCMCDMNQGITPLLQQAFYA